MENSIKLWNVGKYCLFWPVKFKTAEALSAGQLNEESIKAAGTLLSVILIL
jgi:hypothetical protein